MRDTMLAMLALLSGTVVLAGPTPAAAAYDYPGCAMGGELGGSGNCPYRTREQCQASVSGRSGLHCDVNKRVLFRQQRGGERQGAPQRRNRAAQYDHNNEPYFGASQGYAPGEKQRFLDDVRRRD